MKMTVYIFCYLFLSLPVMSCKEKAEHKDPEVIINEPVQENNSVISTIDSAVIIEKLQGKWKEIEYPYRLAHFKNTTVKFTEEGVVEEPTFRTYRISKDCPFAVNNIKNASLTDIFLVMPEAETCEIVKISGDTLTLSGFNIHAYSDYNILYGRVE